jgi:copper homeostasis protein CutC
MNTENQRAQLAEVVADIAFNAGHLTAKGDIDVDDSRTLMHEIGVWARQFHQAYDREKHADNYMLLIDEYAGYRLQDHHEQAESVLARMQS